MARQLRLHPWSGRGDSLSSAPPDPGHLLLSSPGLSRHHPKADSFIYQPILITPSHPSETFLQLVSRMLHSLILFLSHWPFSHYLWGSSSSFQPLSDEVSQDTVLRPLSPLFLFYSSGELMWNMTLPSNCCDSHIFISHAYPSP